eukprot:GGOE01036626.1.p1 GENE.GGOE01036626.1~~GGOE01036626.1.p1  ORF type:complete len:306 (+),score=27.61 GGOE01036626.1:79-996(+)
MQGATAFCSQHGKLRLISCMMDPGDGAYCCSPGNECKGEVPITNLSVMPATPNVPCSVHGKMRTVGHVMEISPGLYQCRPGSECKGAVVKPMALCRIHQKFRRQELLQLVEVTSEGAHFYECKAEHHCQQSAMKRPASPATDVAAPLKVGGDSDVGITERVVCCVHGKLRLASCMQQDERGQWRCHPEEPCRLPSGPTCTAPTLAIADDTPILICAAHGRPRSLPNLVLGADGQHYCLPTDPCRTVSLPTGLTGQSTVLCALHGRMRSIMRVHAGPDGQYQCQPGSECKGSASETLPLHSAGPRL